MAALSSSARGDLAAEVQRTISDARQSTALTKAQWRTLIDSLDDVMENNAAAINQAIPAAVRSTATTQEKALALMVVVARRYLDGA